jgi:hypothetical protein
MSGHKFKVGACLWYATKFCVDEVTVLEQTQLIDGALSYKVKYNNNPSSTQADVFERNLHERRLDALHDALSQNDISQNAVNNSIRDEVALLDKLQAHSRYIRRLLYEEQIMEYMKITKLRRQLNE